MNPVLKRTLLNGGLTALILVLVGLLFTELAGVWSAGHAPRPGAADLNPALPDDLRYRVPLTMAAMGFAFVAASELIVHLLRRKTPAPAVTSEPRHTDDTEKLLNELLAQAELRMALEKKAEDGGQGTEAREQEPHGSPA